MQVGFGYIMVCYGTWVYRKIFIVEAKGGGMLSVESYVNHSGWLWNKLIRGLVRKMEIVAGKIKCHASYEFCFYL
jgi:hypothetical protein